MKRNSLLTFGILGLCLAGCTKAPENGQVLQVDAKVRIEPVISKATSANFEDGDRIGLTIRKTDGTAHADNACLTYSGKEFSSDLKWYAQGGESCSISAYYPYSEAGVPTSFTVESDQSAGAGTSDFMTAVKHEVYPQAGAVMAVFKHKLTQLVINIDNKAGAVIDGVTVCGVLPKVNVSADAEGALSVETDLTAEAVTLKAQVIEAGKKYRVIMAPQTSKFEVKVLTGGSTLVTGVDEAELLSGFTYTVGVEVLADKVKASIAGDIEAWTDGGTLGGVVIDESEAEENDGYIVYHGVQYRTVELGGRKWMAEPLVYVPNGVAVSDDPTSGSVWYPYSSDGTTATPLKDEASIKTLGYLYNFETAFGTRIDESSFNKLEKAQGICPKGWHIPSRAEYFALFGYAVKSELAGETGSQEDKKALFWDASINYASIVNANAQGFNFSQSGAVNNKKYQTIICKDSTCEIPEYVENKSLALTYLMVSTATKRKEETNGSISYYYSVGMTTFSNTYGQGRLSLAEAISSSGAQVRCIKSL